MVFDENKLREDIVKTWGPAGVHTEVFDKILKQALSSKISFPIPINTVTGQCIKVQRGTGVLFNHDKFYVLQDSHHEVSREEIEKYWPAIKLTNTIGKKGAFLKFQL